MFVIGYLARSWYCFLHIHPKNEMSGRSRKKGYRIHRNHIKECLQEVTYKPFCPHTFCGLRIYHTQQVVSLGSGLGRGLEVEDLSLKL